MGRECFFSSRETAAFLKTSGNIHSDRDRLTRLVIGAVRTSTHDLSNFEGIGTRQHEESVEDKIRLRISSVVAGSKAHS